MIVNQTAATAESLGEQAEEQRVSGRKRVPEYPGAQERHFNTFWIGTKELHNEVEVIFLSDPIQFFAYRTAVEAMSKNGRTWPLSALHQSRRYRLKDVSGVLVKKTIEDESDLYADAFGDVAERWVVVPVLVRTPQYNDLGIREKFTSGSKKGKPLYNEAFRFVELGPGSPALIEIQKAMSHPKFAKSGQGLIGSMWIVTKKGKKPPTDGQWRLKTKTTETGETYIQFPKDKLFGHVIAEANREVSREEYDRGVRKLYYSRFEDAYPFATPAQMTATLQLHCALLEDHPDFDKRFPAMIKRLSKNGELIGTTASTDNTDLDDELDDAEGGEVGSLSDLGDNDEPDFGGGLDEDEDTTDVAETTDDADDDSDDGPQVYYANGKDDKDGYVLEDDTPCDEDGNPLTASEETPDEETDDEAEEPDDAAEVEDPETDAKADSSTVDGAEDAGIADEDGDTSAFDFANEAEEETKAVKEKQEAKKKAVSKKPVEKDTKKPAKTAVKKAVKKKAVKKK